MNERCFMPTTLVNGLNARRKRDIVRDALCHSSNVVIQRTVGAVRIGGVRAQKRIVEVFLGDHWEPLGNETPIDGASGTPLW